VALSVDKFIVATNQPARYIALLAPILFVNVVGLVGHTPVVWRGRMRLNCSYRSEPTRCGHSVYFR